MRCRNSHHSDIALLTIKSERRAPGQTDTRNPSIDAGYDGSTVRLRHTAPASSDQSRRNCSPEPAEGLRSERGNWVANYDPSPGDCEKSLRRQFGRNYDQKKVGNNYRAEHLFCLQQAYDGFKFVRGQIAAVDVEVHRLQVALCPLETPAAPAPAEPKPERKSRRVGGKNAPDFPVTTLIQQLCGVDLTTIPGLSAPTLQTLWSELGSSLNAFPTAKHFASWLALCPDNRISGGKTLSVATRATANRVAHALRVAAQGVGHAYNEIGEFHRRMRARLGGAAAVTATAHKLARILYACLRDKSTYDPSRHDLNSPLRRAKALSKLRARAQNLGFQLVELQPAS